MKTFLLAAVVLVSLALAFFLGSSHGRKQTGAASAAGGRKILYYVDPMNPSHTSDKPGLAPCGMKMEPVYADTVVSLPGSGPLLPGTVKLTAEKQQLIGVQVGVAEKKPLRHNLRLLGRVAVDETRSYQVTAPAEGWISKAMPQVVGSYVKRDETLASFYSPTFISAGQAFRAALEYQDRMQTNAVERSIQRSGLAEFNVKQYRDSLRNLGVSDRQIDDMIRTRQYSELIDIVAPADGFVTVRGVSHGQRFEKGAELFRVVDLSRVWIVADLFEREAPLVQPGVEATVTFPGALKPLPAKLGGTLPIFDPVARTLKLRFEADNPDFVLKPDMFVDIEFAVSLPETLIIPAEAVLDSGLRKSVFVDRGNGIFEPRTIQTGWRIGDQVQVLQGLMAGERIVVSGNFLLDSESRMKLAASGVHGAPAMDPVCGMAVDENQARAAKRLSDHQGKTYFFCNDGCKKEFDANPGQYLSGAMAKSAAMPEAQPARGKDPVCGMMVIEAKARAAKRFIEYQGKTYFFCNDSCKEEFDAEPAKYLATTKPK